MARRLHYANKMKLYIHYIHKDMVLIWSMKINITSATATISATTTTANEKLFFIVAVTMSTTQASATESFVNVQ